jgi:hypothetical protein
LLHHAKVLPGIWVFTRKRDHSAKARFCVGGHCQILGRDYFAHKNYCAVLSSRNHRILLALGGKLVQMKVGLFIKLILFRLFFMAFWMMRIYTCSHLRVFLAQ